MTTEEMHALKRSGLSFREIGIRSGLSHQAVFYRLGGERRSLKAANDNEARYTKLVPHNGGCSTTSGMVPVTLARQVAA